MADDTRHNVEWMGRARCAAPDVERADFYAHNRTGIASALQWCRRCPVVEECLAYVMAFEEDDPGLAAGVAGGMSAKARTRRARSTPER